MKKFMLPQALLDVVKFTVTPSSGRTVTLDGFTAPLGGVVDWGDGSVSPLVSSAALSHTYGSSAARQIALRGTVGGFWNTTASVGKNLVTSLDEISSRSLYSCSHFKTDCKTSGCTRVYQSGQSAYYRCTRAGGSCQEISCPYPYANETSYNNARANGWA